MLTRARNLGCRLRQLRQASSKTQSEVARALGVSRSTVAQMELGNRKVRADEIDRLASLYGCSVSSLLSVRDESGSGGQYELVSELVESLPEVAESADSLGELSEAVAICCALTELEVKLGLDVYSSGPPAYGFSTPKTAWEAVHQGYEAAEEERRRMNLGEAPIRDVDDTLAVSRVRATRIALPDGVSALYLRTPETGVLVAVNRMLPVQRRRFHYAHGYAHAIFESQSRWLVCRQRGQDSLIELRAHAFAGRFLVPQQGVQRYLQSLGKETLGRSSGAVVKVHSEPASSRGRDERLRVNGRGRRGATPISPCDLAQIACYFGVSRSLVAHSLRNLRYISDQQLEALERMEAAGTSERAQQALALHHQQVESGRDAFRSRLLALAVEGLRRKVLDLQRFDALGTLVSLNDAQKRALLDSAAV